MGFDWQRRVRRGRHRVGGGSALCGPVAGVVAVAAFVCSTAVQAAPDSVHLVAHGAPTAGVVPPGQKALPFAFPVRGSSPGWTIQSTPNGHVPSDSMSQVSCSAADSCAAVGSYESASHGLTLAEAWSGSAWKVQSTPNPTGAVNSGLDGVSCTAADACIAVGGYEISAALPTLAEAWNGSAWKIQSTPNPTGAVNSNLTAVSCVSAAACTAVGYSSDSFLNSHKLTLAEVWNGSAWKIQTTPNPTGATYVQLSGISCTAADACTAAGAYESSSGSELTLVEAWNGSVWRIQSTPNPTGATNSQLNGVSCTAANACTAVGYYYDGSGHQLPFAEAWNGSVWKLQAVPAPSLYGQLNAVSCTATVACSAVGMYSNGRYNVTLAEVWNGSAWKIQSTPNPAGATGSPLNGVSCVAAAACTAVGAYFSAAGPELTLAEALNGGTWKIESTPNRIGLAQSSLNGVSCTASSACAAVGSYYTGNGYLALAETRSGSSWTVTPTPSPTGATSVYLNGVSCTAADACTAVGGYGNSTGRPLTLAEEFRSGSWQIQSTPNPSGATGSQLTGVSCTAPDTCTAVGSYANSSGVRVTLAEVLTGGSWHIESTPNPSGATQSQLNGVSCPAAGACTAVGYYRISSGAEQTLAEVWNGSGWKIQSTANPTGTTISHLNGVSCTAANACTAVGYYDNSSFAEQTLAEVFNTGSWKVQSTPNPATNSALTGVSCTAADQCTAAGSGDQLTVEAENGGAWTIQSTPNPAGADSSGALGVSCTAAQACTAAGAFTESSGRELTLAEADM